MLHALIVNTLNAPSSDGIFGYADVEGNANDELLCHILTRVDKAMPMMAKLLKIILTLS